jgi:hypothetical protein
MGWLKDLLIGDGHSWSESGPNGYKCSKCGVEQTDFDLERNFTCKQIQAFGKDCRFGALAYCGIDCLGLITSYTPEEVTYQDGSKRMAWTGIHLTDKVGKIGAPWSSTKPRVVGRMKESAARELRNALAK